MEGLLFVHRETVRFRDHDGVGHVRPSRPATKSFELERWLLRRLSS